MHFFFFKVGLGGMVDRKNESQTKLNSESYVSGRIDFKTGEIHNESYTPTSESYKSSNTQKKLTLKNIMSLHM